MLILYRLAMLIALPVLLAMALWRRVSGQDPPKGLAERLGFVPGPGADRTLWLHAASVGEVTSARWVLEDILTQRPDVAVLVTTNTATARAMVAGWRLAGVTAALAPFDTAGSVPRLLRRWHPGALITVEGELWPARLDALRCAKIPVVVIGARLSARSANRWARVPGLARVMLGGLTYVSAQDAASLSRLLTLGLSQAAAGPVLDLKPLAAMRAARLNRLPGPAPRAQVLLAASTHEGEEDLVLDAFGRQSNFTHLILAPRHPDRGDKLAAMIGARGLDFGRRTSGQLPSADRAVFLADTLGEMPLWYGMAGACLIGGSLVPRGGHTPFEPGQYDCALLHGPSVTNFAEVFARLDRAKAALAVEPGDLDQALAALSAERQNTMARRAAPILQPDGSGLTLAQKVLARQILTHAGLETGPGDP